MFYSYNYFRQYNNNEEIKDHKTFYKKFSNEREFGGEFTHLDHLVKTRFANMINPMFSIVLRNHPEKVLDIGCGDGVNLPLANLFSEIEYHGLDYAEKTIEVARRNYPNINFKVGDAFNLPYEDELFDMAILSSVLILYREEEDRIQLIKEALRVLKKDGILVLNVWNDTWMIRNCLRLSRALGRIKGDRLPEDFMGCHFNPKDVKSMTVKAGGVIVERIQTAQLFGVLECAQYINRKKYQRAFGKESFHKKKLPQNIKKDLFEQAGGNPWITAVLYRLNKLFKNQFSWFNIYILEKKATA